VKPGSRVAVSGVDDADFARDLRGRDAQHVQEAADVVFLGVEDSDGLDGIAAAWARAAPGGALWVVYPTGVRVVTEHDVRQAGLALGIVDVKVVRFSATHTGMRFVARRTPRRVSTPC
jgi:hypothetical protein